MAYRYGQPLQDVAPSPLEALVGNLLGSYREDHEAKRRRELEMQDRATAASDRERTITRQNEADTENRAAFDVKMGHEGYTRGPATNPVPTVDTPDVPGVVAPFKLPTVQGYGATAGAYTKTGASEAERSATHEETVRVATDAAARRLQETIGANLVGAYNGDPEALKRLTQASPDTASKVLQEQAKSREAATNDARDFENKKALVRLEASLRPKASDKPDPKADQAANVLGQAEDAYGTLISLREKGYKPNSVQRWLGTKAIDPDAHSLLSSGLKVGANIAASDDDIAYQNAVRVLVEAETKATPGAKGLGVVAQRHEVVGRSNSIQDELIRSIRRASIGHASDDYRHPKVTDPTTGIPRHPENPF